MNALLSARGTSDPKMYNRFWAFHRWLIQSSQGASSLRAESQAANISAFASAAVVDSVTQYIYETCDHRGTRALKTSGHLKILTNIWWFICTLLIVFKVFLCAHVISKLNSCHQRSSVCSQLWTLPPSKSMCILSIFKWLTTNWVIV